MDSSTGTSSSKSSESKGSLKSIATGLFINWDKRNILIKAVETSLRDRFNTEVECGPQLPGNLCQLTLRALDPPPPTPSTSLTCPRRSCLVNFAGSKELLETYLTLVKESRPNFVIEKRSETIDLDSDEDDEVCVIAYDTLSTGSEGVVITHSENKTNDGPECTKKNDNVVTDFVDLIETENEGSNGKSPDNMVVKHGYLGTKNFPLDIVNISDDVIDVDSCDEEPNQNTTSNIDFTNYDHNFSITTVGENRSVSYTSRPNPVNASSSGNENRKRKYTSANDQSESKSKNMRLTCQNSKASWEEKIKYWSANGTSEFCTLKGQVAVTNVKQSCDKKETNAVEGLAMTHSHDKVDKNPWQQFKESVEKENHSSVAPVRPSCSSKQKKKSGKTLLTYQRLPHLSQSAEGSCASTSAGPSNIFNPVGPVVKKTGLRPIVIDGNNVGVGHGGKGQFSLRGVQLCVNYFEKRGHREIKVFLPQYRKNRENFDALNEMENRGIVVFTPSRRVNERIVASYDDRYVVQYAHEVGGVIISNDHYRDLIAETPEWKDTVQNRLLMFTWVNDVLMFPRDPLGQSGPSLDQYLKF